MLQMPSGSGASILSAKINQVLIFPKLGRFFCGAPINYAKEGPPELLSGTTFPHHGPGPLLPPFEVSTRVN